MSCVLYAVFNLSLRNVFYFSFGCRFKAHEFIAIYFGMEMNYLILDYYFENTTLGQLASLFLSYFVMFFQVFFCLCFKKMTVFLQLLVILQCTQNPAITKHVLFPFSRYMEMIGSVFCILLCYFFLTFFQYRRERRRRRKK